MFNKLIASLLPYMPQKLIWIFSKAYIAGEKVEDAIRVSKELNREGIRVTIDVLGEFIKDLDEAERNKQEYLELISKMEEEKVDGNYSVKPTSFGLLIDKEVCYNNIREIVLAAKDHHNFVRIDMEDSSCVDMEIELYRKLQKEFPRHVGLVLQSYMKRTPGDLNNFLDIHSADEPLNFRLCKGIYVEPPEIAFKDHDEVNQYFLKNLDFMLQHGMYPGIATHDRFLIKESYKLLERYKVSEDKYEFQMLYGVTPDLRRSIVEKGHKMLVYVPFGKDWFGYSTRRLKENPKMASYIIKAIFRKG